MNIEDINKSWLRTGLTPAFLHKQCKESSGARTAPEKVGHADFKRPHRFLFDKGFESYSGAGVTGCGSGGSNAKIPPIALIPGAPNHKDEVLSTDPEYLQGVVNTRNGALTKAGQICKDPKQCCKQVRIYYFDAPKNDGLEDALFQNKKPMIEIYDCAAGRITKTINNYFVVDRSKEK